MEVIVPTVVSGLVLSAITGLAYIAYRHPAAYKSIDLVLILLTALILTALHVWNLAIGLAASKAGAAVEFPDSSLIRDAVYQLWIPYPYLIPGSLLWLVYLIALSNLPRILHLDVASHQDSDIE